MLPDRTGRLTYSQLASIINREMTDDQKNSDVTVEVEDECFAAEVRIGHDSLDENHPVLFVPDDALP